jgi:hypothetical protein
MSELAFVSPGEARAEGGFAPRPASPLARALDGADGLRDLSLLGKVEVRGELDGLPPDLEVLRITSRRALVLCPLERCAELLDSASGLALDMTAALAGIELEGETLFRRLTDLDANALPAAGKVADVPAIVAGGGGRFRIFFSQEYGHSVVEAVRDAQEGLA